MKTLFTLLLSALYLISYAQAPHIEWQQSFGGSEYEQARNIQQTTDGGYIIAGLSNSDNGNIINHHGLINVADCWIIKIDSLGIIDWQKSLGGSDVDVANSIKQTTDGGYIMAGYTISNDGDVSGNNGFSDCWVVNLSEKGNIEWQKTFGGSSADGVNDVEQTKDGGYIIAGYAQSNDGRFTGNHGYFDYYIIKLDLTGNIEWEKLLGGSLWDYPESIKQTTDGGFIIGGISQSNDGDVSGNHGNSDCWIVKLNYLGNLVWQKSFGGINYESADDIEQTPDGGYIVAGSSSSNDGDVSGHHGNTGYYDYWIIKFSGIGKFEWQKSLGGINDDKAFSIRQTADKGYIIAGYSTSNDGDVSSHHGSKDSADYWIVKLDSLKNIEWQKSLGGSSNDYAFCINHTNDQGYIISGTSSSNNGDINNNHGGYDYWIVKLKPDVVLPITLLNFSASSQQNETVLLSWVTANEINNDFFAIERSNNNKAFISIGSVYANVKPQLQNHYSFIDSTPITGKSYYRLKQTDKDGKYTYSKIIPVNIAGSKFLIKPNPSNDGMFVVDLGSIKTNLSIIISDNGGKIVYTQDLERAQILNINLNKPKGVYYLQVNYSDGKEYSKLLIQ